MRRRSSRLARGAKYEDHAMSHTLNAAIAVIGTDIGKNSFHIVGLDQQARSTVVCFRPDLPKVL